MSAAIEAAKLLKDHLDVTVLIDAAAEHCRRRASPNSRSCSGTIRAAKGSSWRVRDHGRRLCRAAAVLARRAHFRTAQNGAVSRCDILLDLSGGAPLFPGRRSARRLSARRSRRSRRRAEGRAEGARPRRQLRQAALHQFHRRSLRAFALAASSAATAASISARPARSLPPAITSRSMPQICAGCGQCAAACPTGAAAYALPPADALMRKLRTLLTAYREAGGARPVLLFHDDEHGGALIDALARHGDGLPANVLPLAVNEVTQSAWKRSPRLSPMAPRRVRFLLRAKPRHDLAGLRRRSLSPSRSSPGSALRASALPPSRPTIPIALGEASARHRAAGRRRGRRAFQPVGGKRDVLRLALRELHRAAPAPVDVDRAAGTARRSARSRSMSKAARCACPASPPARPARCRTIPSGRCCASPRMPACNAGSARRPVRKR